MATYTVKKGDTLSEIAWTYNPTYNYGSTVTAAHKRLAEINDIDDPDRIVVGQVLTLDNPKNSDGSNATIKKKKNATSKPTIKSFGLQSNTDRSIYASWSWSKSNTENYKVMWYYATGDGIWFVGEDGTTEYKQAVYSAPSNATKVKFKVKPISKKRTVKKKETSYWTASWSSTMQYNFSDNPPSQPSAPTVTIDNFKLTATIDNLNINATKIQFQVIKNNSSTYTSGTANISTSSATYTCTVAAGGEYKVRCRGVRGDEYGEWSDYSSSVGTIPNAPSGITSVKALSATSVQVNWSSVSNCKSYEIQYTTNKTYFDSNSSEVKSVTVESVVTHTEITGMESGSEYFFRVRAVNDKGNSSWTGIKSIIIGKAPAAPTTWSSSTTVITGESLTLYWVHNSEDGSKQTYAQLELIINGTTTTQTIQSASTAEDEEETTSFYPINTSGYVEGSTIQWRVRTAGITKEYGDWSVQRTIDIYAPPTLEFSITNASGTAINVIESFPFYATALAGPNTQRPIGYHLTVMANESYETEDQVGNTKIVSAGEAVYTRYFDVSETLLVELSAGNIDLENNISYTAICTVSMNSGLTAEASADFTVTWEDKEYEPNAELSYDNDTYAVHIRPYCVDEDEVPVTDVTLSVYRREFDGGFVEIATDLTNSDSTFITDPHPALDYARYRIVATTISTGSVSYYDLPGYPIEEASVIIQWDEEWSYFETSDIDEADVPEQPPWAGSLVKLPYNIDISDKSSKDVSLIEYIGRKRPVSYYGTQLGESSSWKVEIDKEDKETLYALRRLAIYTGDVYVREPSGSGYWANISVSFSQTHLAVTIPVTLDITRVEGGI